MDPARLPESFAAVAYNPVPNSENRIHGDEVARRHGFRGGLVPGVVVSAYLLDPALRAYGRAALRGSYAEVVVHKPLYDGDGFEVRIEAQDVVGYQAALFDSEGTRCAEGSFALAREPAQVPEFDEHMARAPRPADRPPATREVLEQLQRDGMGYLRARLDAEHEMARYHATRDAQPELVRPEPGGCASFAFLLGLTNWAIARNVRLGPWLHLQTWSHQLVEVPFGAELVVQPKVVDLFERKGHQFVDIDVAAFTERPHQGADDGERTAVLAARMRCIYALRGS